MKLSYTIENVILKIEELEQELKNIDNPQTILQIENDLSTLEIILQEMESVTPSEIPNNYRTISQQLESETKNFAFFLEDIKRFRELTAQKMFNVPELPCNNLSQNQLINLLLGFYNSVDPELYSVLKTIFANSSIRFTKDSNSSVYGETYFLHYKKECFISINSFNTLQDFFTIIHEFAHGINFYFNNESDSVKNKYFMEIITLFMELLAADYYQQTFRSTDPIIYTANEFNNYVLIARNIDALLKLLSQVSMNFKSSQTRKILNSNKNGNQIYLTAYLFAIELYHLYKIDPEYSLYLLKYILRLPIDNPPSFYKQLIDLDLVPNAHLSEHYQNLFENVQSLKLVKH